MLVHFIYLLIFVYSGVKTDMYSGFAWRDMDNTVIELSEHCDNNQTCIIKCCPYGQLLHLTPEPEAQLKSLCVPTDNKISLDFTKISAYKRDSESSAPRLTNISLSRFTFIGNDRFWDTRYMAYTMYWLDIYVLQDGSLYSSYENCAKLEYCIDFLEIDGVTKLVYKTIDATDRQVWHTEYFNATGLVVSSLCMVLVLLVYGILPQLRNNVGIILMSYLVTQVLSFILRAGQLFAQLRPAQITKEECQALSPAVYYFTMSSFFWLNVMSFDLWWTTRTSLVRRQAEVITFNRYSLYAWGAPALLTLAEVVVDRSHVLADDNPYRIPFDSCFSDDLTIPSPTLIHVHLPIAVMTTANWIMFLLTASYVWKTKRALTLVTSSADTRTTDRPLNRYAVCIKMSVLMGVHWILEIIPRQDLVLHIFINAYNVLIGVPILVIFVCKRSVIESLCARCRKKMNFISSVGTSQNNEATATETPSFSRIPVSRAPTSEETDLTVI